MNKNELVWEFDEPLQKESAIEDFEIDFAYKIPSEIKTLIQKHNCAYPSKDTFDTPREGMVFAHLLSFNPDSSESVFYSWITSRMVKASRPCHSARMDLEI